MDTVQRVAPPVPVRWACLVLMVFPGLLACMGDAPPEGARVSAAGTVLVTLREGTNMSLALSPDRRTLALDIQGTLWTLPVEGGDGECHHGLPGRRSPAFVVAGRPAHRLPVLP